MVLIVLKCIQALGQVLTSARTLHVEELMTSLQKIFDDHRAGEETLEALKQSLSRYELQNMVFAMDMIFNNMVVTWCHTVWERSLYSHLGPVEESYFTYM